MFLKDTAFSKWSTKEAKLNYPRTEYKSARRACEGVWSLLFKLHWHSWTFSSSPKPSPPLPLARRQLLPLKDISAMTPAAATFRALWQALEQTVSCEALQHFCRRNGMPSLYIKNQGLCDFANEKLNSLGISLGLMKSFHCNFCCCLCWGLLRLPQHKRRGACGYGSDGQQWPLVSY